MAVVVFGSLNMDLVTRTPRLPLPGETLLGADFLTTPGGKGANQAVAVAKLGVPTWMVGRVGNDGFGQELLAGLQTVGVKGDRVAVDPACHTGVAMITVAETGENQIIGVFGANGQVDATDVDRLIALLPQAQVLLVQLEVNVAAVQLAVQAGRAAGVCVILDPAPVQTPDLTALYPFVDILVPNEVEASQLVGFPVHDRPTAEQAAIVLQRQGVPTVIVKLGAQGCVCLTPEEAFFTPAFAVDAIDSVAAGDAFAGGLAAALVAGLPIRTAILWGSAAGALATTRHGAQTAMPDREQFEHFLKQVLPNT
jgi:ribokinase